MKKILTNIMPVGAPWGGPESFTFLSCFTSLYMYLEKIDCTGVLYCDHDDRLCNRCGECGVTAWENKYHEQLYHGFLTLSGVSCYTVWPEDAADAHYPHEPFAFSGDEFITRTLDFAGYTWRILQNAPEAEMRAAILHSIDNDCPVLVERLVNDDWSLVHGYDADGDTLFGQYVADGWEDPQRKPQRVEDGVFTKANWFHADVRVCLVTGWKDPRREYAELFTHLRATLRRPDHTQRVGGLAAFDACKTALLDEPRIAAAGRDELARMYTNVHTWIGLLAESRCFAAFAFWPGFFGRVTDEARLARMKAIGDRFMDTHNQCWGAWAAMGKDHHCQPEVYLDKFVQRETRQKLVEYLDIFKANDETAIRVLDEICALGPTQPTDQDFTISQMRVLNMPEITFFYVTSQPTPFAKLDEVLDPLLDGLYAARRLAAISESGPDIVRYYPAGGEGNHLYIMEVGIVVQPETQPAGGAQVKRLPPYPCAAILLWGGLAHIGQTYAALGQAMQAGGLRHTGEVRECTYSFESPVSPNNLMGIFMGV